MQNLLHIIAAIILTVLPGSWAAYGLRLTGIPSQVRLPLAIALSPAIVGVQLVILEAISIPFAVSAYVIVFLNLPPLVLLMRHHRTERGTGEAKFWLSSLPLTAMLIAIPVLIWLLIPGIRTYTWNAMIQTDVIYAITRAGVQVEETNLADLNLAYGWIGHSYWSLIGWIGDWAPTTVYPFTNVIWIVVSFILGYQLGRSGLGFHRNTALLGSALMFLSTNVIGMVLLIGKGYSQWWARYFGDIRYSPFLSKFYGFDTMIWGMALLIGMALLYTIALRKKVTSLEGLTVALLISLGLVYPVLFPAGLILVSCFMLLAAIRMTDNLPKYSRWDLARFGFSVVLSAITVWLYLSLTTANRDTALFAFSSTWEIRNKIMRFLGAMLPFIFMAALPILGFLRRWNESALLLALSAAGLSAVYIIIDLAQLEYKYVLAATICLSVLAAASMDTFFRQYPRLGWMTANAISIGLVVVNLLLVFRAGAHIPGNLDQGAMLDENSFWITLSPTEPDFVWTKAIHENTSEDTVVIARRPGIQLSAVVGRSMYIPSDIDGGFVPGYNLNQNFYLVQQRGYPADVYEKRLGVVETLYTSEDEAAVINALQELKAIQRPIAIKYSDQGTYSLGWLDKQRLGSILVSDDQHIVWLIESFAALP